VYYTDIIVTIFPFIIIDFIYSNSSNKIIVVVVVIVTIVIIIMKQIPGHPNIKQGISIQVCILFIIIIIINY